MAQARQWTVPPDETGAVDQEELAAALYDAGVLLRRAGGAIGIQAIRERDELAFGGAEHVTTSVVFQWYARTDSKPRFEGEGTPAAPAPAPEEPAEVEDADEPEAG